MKRLSGGLVLLNLTAISLGLTSGEVNITDAGILEELTELRQFIDVNRDFSKGFKNLKPIMIEYRSSASKFNGITQANLSFNTDALHMSIGANTIQADGKLLVITINVVYEYTDYVGYTIKSAKLNAYETLADGDATFTGDVGVGGDLEVTGNAVLPEINGEENPSVKPIYYHPITTFNNRESDGKKKFALGFTILNNSNVAFTKDAFIQWIKDLVDNVPNNVARLNVDGGYDDILSIAYIYCYKDNNEYYAIIVGFTSLGYDEKSPIILDNLLLDAVSFDDGVNKIN